VLQHQENLPGRNKEIKMSIAAKDNAMAGGQQCFFGVVMRHYGCCFLLLWYSYAYHIETLLCPTRALFLKPFLEPAGHSMHDFLFFHMETQIDILHTQE
jgi:hypothetical protein